MAVLSCAGGLCRRHPSERTTGKELMSRVTGRSKRWPNGEAMASMAAGSEGSTTRTVATATSLWLHPDSSLWGCHTVVGQWVPSDRVGKGPAYPEHPVLVGTRCSG